MEALQYFFSDEVYDKWKDKFDIPCVDIDLNSRIAFIRVIIPGINETSYFKNIAFLNRSYQPNYDNKQLYANQAIYDVPTEIMNNMHDAMAATSECWWYLLGIIQPADTSYTPFNSNIVEKRSLYLVLCSRKPYTPEKLIEFNTTIFGPTYPLNATLFKYRYILTCKRLFFDDLVDFVNQETAATTVTHEKLTNQLPSISNGIPTRFDDPFDFYSDSDSEEEVYDEYGTLIITSNLEDDPAPRRNLIYPDDPSDLVNIKQLRRPRIEKRPKEIISKDD